MKKCKPIDVPVHGSGIFIPYEEAKKMNESLDLEPITFEEVRELQEIVFNYPETEQDIKHKGLNYWEWFEVYERSIKKFMVQQEEVQKAFLATQKRLEKVNRLVELHKERMSLAIGHPNTGAKALTFEEWIAKHSTIDKEMTRLQEELAEDLES